MVKERQVRYNCIRSKQNLNCNEFIFLIINQNREIREIEQKIYSLFSPIIQEFDKLEGIISDTGLRYKLINFDSPTNVEDGKIRGLYKRVIKDAKLYSRKDNKEGPIEKYLSNFID
jgi:hypothetical protein